MRYEVRPYGHGSSRWRVIDHHKRYSINLLTEAEAKIIAFALNAVADGVDLAASSRPLVEGWDDLDWYNGPTEGVAPDASAQS